MTSIELQHIGKTFPNAVALDDINLQIPPGELLFLLGPSGCGKSTLLRIIAGLLEPTGGKILFDGRDVTQLHTDQRNAVMCFQNYALWPHMTIRQNVAFGLSMHGGSSASHSARATEVLRLVQLDQYADRKPNSLSGGQQQRAALARALAVEPKCLLLDEPLSNLDAKLRLEMRSEIRRLCKSGGYTTLYVTHDQKEALSIADRIVLLKEGRIAQIGSPAELYHHPCNGFVADFIGQTNLLRGSAIDESSETRRVQTEIGPLLASAAAGLHAHEVIVSIRPEKIRVLTADRPKSPGANHLSGTILENTFLGEASEHIVQINGHPLKLSSSPPILDAAGVVSLEIDPSDCIILPE
jgi:iron(III) transport system ATP-binding protein